MQVMCGCGGVRGGWSLNAFSDALCVRAMCCEIKYGIVSTVKVLVLVTVSLNFWYRIGWVGRWCAIMWNFPRADCGVSYYIIIVLV